MPSNSPPVVNKNSDADALYRYGGGSGPIHFAGFHCSGSESSLLNCPVNRAGSALITNCGHHEDAGVRCSNGRFKFS